MARRTPCARASARVFISFFGRGNDRVQTSGETIEKELADFLVQPVLDPIASRDRGQRLLIEQRDVPAVDGEHVVVEHGSVLRCEVVTVRDVSLSYLPRKEL